MQPEEWESVQLALELQEQENRERQRNEARLTEEFEDVDLVRALEASHGRNNFSPDRSNADNNINPDNMTYEVSPSSLRLVQTHSIDSNYCSSERVLAM